MGRVSRAAAMAFALLLVVSTVALAATVRGTSGADRLNGTGNADRISGRAGDDRISGRAGNDRLQGGNGVDRIRGGAGNDRLEGNGGDDRANGDAGNDRIHGGRGDDRLGGGAGDDSIHGGPGNDVLSRSSGSDDYLGGAGDDRIDSQNGVVDRVDCGPGQDTVASDPHDDVHPSCERPAPPAAPVADRTGGWITCAEESTNTSEPGLTMSPQTVLLTNVDVITDCTSSDPTIHSGRAEIRMTSVLASCAAGSLDGVADIRWDNGRNSLLAFTGAFAGAVATARGAIIGGNQFVGQNFYAVDTLRLDPSVFNACASPQGLTNFTSAGRLAIGLLLPGIAPDE